MTLHKLMRLGMVFLFLVSGCRPQEGPQPLVTTSPTPIAPPNTQPTAAPPTPTPPTPTPVATITASAAQAGLAQAEQALFYGDYPRARQLYQELAESTSDERMRAEALLGSGRTLWAAGQTLPALQTLRQLTAAYPSSQAAARAWFLLGEMYLSLQRYQESADAYAQSLRLQNGILDDYIQEQRGNALIALGDYAAALEAYRAAQQFPAPADRTPLEIKIAQTHALLGEYATALALYQDIYARSNNDQVRARVNYRMGEIYQILGENAQAYTRWQENINNYPLAYESYLSLVALLEAEQPVDAFQRGLVDYYAGQYGVALAAFDQHIAATASPNPSAFYYRGLILQKLGRYEEAIATWQNYITRFPEHRFWVDAWEDIAYTQWAYLERPQQAAQTLTRFTELAPAHPQAPDLLFQAARMWERSGNLETAAQAWEQLAVTYAGSDLAAESLFQAGLMDYRQGNPAQARARFERALLLGNTPAEQARLYLWIGKTYQQQGQNDQAREIWLQGAALDPTGYYSERMRDLLLERPPFSAPTTIQPPADLAQARQEAEAWVRLTFDLPADTDLTSLDPLAADLRFHRGVAFWQLGLYPQARSEFESLRADLADDPANSFRLAAFLSELGLYRSAIFAARNVLDLAGLDDAGTLSAPVYFNLLRFGLYYPELVEQAASQYDLPPLFLWSVMRQESLFESFIQSHADARGLMQIIPPTGDYIAERLGWPPNYSTEDLYRPQVSITFGAYYLATNRNRLNGSLYAALAAYNGGPLNAAAWQALAADDPDLLLEIIRLRETRNYIRSIYEVFNIYRRLYSPAE